MATCLNCKSQCLDTALYCPSCGSLRQSQPRYSYSGSILFGIGLLGFIAIWEIATLVPTSNGNAAQIAPEPPDEAAVLIASCGKPDVDRVAPGKGVSESNRLFIYRKAGVKITFGSESASSVRWKRLSIVDSKTSKPLTTEKIAKRLPCATDTKR